MSLISVDDYEKTAFKKLPRKISDYFRGGAGDEFSLKLNTESFQRLRIIPRVLIDVSKRDLTTNIFGMNLSMPIAVAPTAFHKLAHRDGEIGVAKAAENCGIVFTLSTFSNTKLEEIATSAPNTMKWFQFFIYKDRSLTESFLRRVEASGFNGIVLTLDANFSGIRRADYRNKFSLPADLRMANLEDKKLIHGTDFLADNHDAQMTWKDIKWLKSITKLPLIVKGILSHEDAILAVQHGVDGIIVSNHGARQIDTSPAPIEVLPRIVEAVGDRAVVMMDGGVRQGTDVFKALSLGAKLVLIGRPAIWGLAVDGQKGVEGVLNILRKELDIVMALCGCPTLNDIKKDMVVHESTFSKL